MADEQEQINGAESEEQEELFPSGVVEGNGKTLKNLIKPGQTVTTTCSIGKAEVPLRGGLPDPDMPVRVLTTAIFQSAPPIAQRDDPSNPMKVTGWKIRVNLRADHTETVPATDEGLITQRFKALAEVSPTAAGELLDALKIVMQEQLSIA